jgi:hypothetical protein
LQYTYKILQRCSYPLYSSQPPHQTPTTRTRRPAQPRSRPDTTHTCVIPQNPNSAPKSQSTFHRSTTTRKPRQQHQPPTHHTVSTGPMKAP